MFQMNSLDSLEVGLTIGVLQQMGNVLTMIYSEKGELNSRLTSLNVAVRTLQRDWDLDLALFIV